MKKQLKDICETITKGTTPTTLGYNYQETGINFVKIESINGYGMFEPEKFAHISDDCNIALRRSQLKENDILFSIAGAIGRTAIVNKSILPANTNQALAIIRLNNSEEYNLKFLRYQLASEVVLRQTERQKQGVAQLNLSLKDIGNLELSLPSLSEQQKIAAELDTIQSAIDNKKQQLSLLDEAVKSEFVEMFGSIIENSEKIALEKICDFVTVGIANSATHAFCENGVIMFRNQNIKEDFLDDSDVIYIRQDFADRYKSKALKENDLLIVRTGYPGVCCLVPKKYEGCQTFTTLIARLKEKKDINPKFICHYINSKYGKEYVEKNQAGVAQQNFGATALSKMPMVIPPINLQNKFAAFVQQIDKSKFVVKQQIADLQELLDSKMQEYFS